MKLFHLFHKKSSREVAKDRLKLLLISDRANCTPEVMEMIKNDIVHVISRYMEIDATAMEIQILKTKSDKGKMPALYANIPILDLKKTFGR